MDQGVRITKRLAQLKTIRQPHEQVWADCYAYTFPLRADGFFERSMDAVTGQRKQAQMLDSTASDAACVLAAAMVSGLTPSNARWFGLMVDSDTDEERQWLDESAQSIWENIHASNFDAVSYESMLDDVCAGWFVLYVDEDRELGGYHFEQWATAQCYIASSKPGGLIDTLYREYTLTAEQAVAEYGDNLSAECVKLAKEKPDEKVTFVHAIEPRKDSNPGAIRAKNLPFASCKVEVKTNKVVSESGYHEFPCCVPRWQKLPNSPYAVGKVYDALPDIKELNDLELLNKAGTEMGVAGMYVAEDDGVLNPRSIKIGPRKVIIANSIDSIKPLGPAGDVKLGWVAKQDLQASVRKTLMADQLTPRDGPALTATEVHANLMLLRQQMGPTFGRVQPEYLQVLVERCFGIAYRAGILGEAPASLANREFTVKYISPLARAQQLEEVTAMDRFETTLLQKADVRPELLDLYDWDEADRHRSELLGVPQRLLHDKQTVDEIRQSKAEQQQAMQQQAMMQDVVTKAAPAMLARQ